MKVLILNLIIGSLFASTAFAGAAKFTKKNELIRPEGYRQWVYVGTPITPNDMNGGKAAFPDFHNVYMEPSDFKHFSKTGKFREGTILVKELVGVGTKASVSGKGYFMGEFTSLEATVKSKKRFPKEPNNWAYFSFGGRGGKKRSKTAKAFPTNKCATCHQAAAATDMVFTQHYPVLRAAFKK